MKSKKQKHEEAEFLKQELSEATNLVVVKFQGLNVAKDTELRRAIRDAQSKYRVEKNTLVNLAAEGTPVEELKGSFDGSTAIAYNSDDPVALAKALSDYAKENPAFEFKAGMVEGRAVEISTIAAIASLTSHDELIAKLLYLINAPAQRTATAIKAVASNIAVAIGQAVEKKKFSE